MKRQAVLPYLDVFRVVPDSTLTTVSHGELFYDAGEVASDDSAGGKATLCSPVRLYTRALALPVGLNRPSSTIFLRLVRRRPVEHDTPFSVRRSLSDRVDLGSSKKPALTSARMARVHER